MKKEKQIINEEKQIINEEKQIINESNSEKNRNFLFYMKKNGIVWMYVILSILIEMTAVLAVEKNPFIIQPYIVLGILGMIACLLLTVKKNVVRFILAMILLIIQSIADLVFVVVYDMTDQYFDFGMLNLRNDAWGILESIPMNFIAFYAALLGCILFVVFAHRIEKRHKIVEISSKAKAIYCILAAAMITMTCACLTYNNSDDSDKYQKMVKNTLGSNYTKYGIIGNFINEAAKGIVFNDTEFMDTEEIDDFIYDELSEESSEFGVSKDNNVVAILVESFEWFSFLKTDEYPNGLDLSDEDLKFLFPNLMKFYDESVVLDNFHSKEKTDISETLSILGSYPTDAYIDYDFDDNTIPNTLPNILKNVVDEDIQLKSFHNGYKSFYNREKTHKMFGFENITDCYDMYDLSAQAVKEGITKNPTMHDYLGEGERNLDSEMIETCKDIMFPTDKRFYTYITTITMHGIYYERDNLSEYMDKLLSVYTPTKKNSEEEVLMNYVTTVMEFDKALGVMMDDLDSKGILDNTTILMFGDHNSYYQQLSNYVKDIYDYDTDNYYTDLYKVPLMIYDKNLNHQVIDKFTCTSDIVPTLMDLLGIRYYSNMYYGNSAFSDSESVLYSRAYGFFAGDGIVCRSLNNTLYQSDELAEEYVKQFKERAENLVTKIEYCDQLFYQNYFGVTSNYDKFISNMKSIQ